MMTPIERSSYDVVMTACDLLADLSVERENMSFSQEGLLTDLSTGFQTFLTWVKRKVQELIHKFLIFIRDMKDAYLQVGVSEASFLVSYYFMNVIKHRIFSHDNYNLQVPVVSNERSTGTTMDVV